MVFLFAKTRVRICEFFWLFTYIREMGMKGGLGEVGWVV